MSFFLVMVGGCAFATVILLPLLLAAITAGWEFPFLGGVLGNLTLNSGGNISFVSLCTILRAAATSSFLSK